MSKSYLLKHHIDGVAQVAIDQELELDHLVAVLRRQADGGGLVVGLAEVDRWPGQVGVETGQQLGYLVGPLVPIVSAQRVRQHQAVPGLVVPNEHPAGQSAFLAALVVPTGLGGDSGIDHKHGLQAPLQAST